MNDSQILPDDPRLTAFALGELEGDERALVAAAVASDPALRAAVEAVQATAAQLSAALQDETVDPVVAPMPARAERYGRAAAIIPGGDLQRLDGGPINGSAPSPRSLPPYAPKGRLLRFPQLYYVVGTAAAACFAIVVALREPRPVPVATERKVYREITLQPMLPAADTAAPATEAVAVALDAQEAAPSANPEPVSVTAAVTTPSASGLLDQVRRENPSPVVATRPAVGSTTLNRAGENRVASAGNRPPFAHGEAAKSRVVEAKASTTLANDANSQVVTLQPFMVSDTPDRGYTSGVALSAGNVNRVAGPPLPFGGVGLGSGRPASVVLGPPGAMPPLPQAEPAAPVTGVVHLTEAYAHQRDNDFLAVGQNPLSTFSIDVDTASYTNVRRMLNAGNLPPADAVRIEELINYFPYRYAPPTGDAPFAATMEVAEAPWAPAHRLVRIGLKAREVATENRPAANLVFLLDVSGSMNAANKLPLVKESLRLLLGKLRSDDRVAVVTYAGNSGLALPSTPVARSREILAAIDTLQPGGSTNGAMGIQLAYDIAKANFVAGAANRVILCTDGDFNVGVTSQGELVRLVEEKAKSGVFLTVLGFGMGNLKDATLESLADKGNGQYGYIDTRREAEKLLVEQVSGTLVTVAKDVKLQVEFNPAKVASYRLIGYENRLLKKEDFNNDQVDAGEIGAGHTVTALYEIVPVGAETAVETATVDELRYQPVGGRSRVAVAPAVAGELLTLKVRYKAPDGDVSRKLEFPLVDSGARFEMASADFKFASAVAGFGMLLRQSPHKGSTTIGDVIAWAAAGATNLADDRSGYRSEFLVLARRVQELMPR